MKRPPEETIQNLCRLIGTLAPLRDCCNVAGLSYPALQDLMRRSDEARLSKAEARWAGELVGEIRKSQGAALIRPLSVIAKEALGSERQEEDGTVSGSPGNWKAAVQQLKIAGFPGIVRGVPGDRDDGAGAGMGAGVRHRFVGLGVLALDALHVLAWGRPDLDDYRQLFEAEVPQ